MKKIALFSILIFAIFSVSVQALTLDPSSGNKNLGDVISIDLIAKPNGTGQNAVRIRLHVDGGEVQDFTPITDPKWLGTISECSNNQTFDAQDLCLSMAKTSTIETGEKLGTMQVKANNTRSLTISKGNENGYTDGFNFTPDTGIAATFTVNGSAPVLEVPNPQPENIQPVPSTNVVSNPVRQPNLTTPGVIIRDVQQDQTSNLPLIIAVAIILLIVIGSVIVLIIKGRKKTAQLPATGPQPSPVGPATPIVQPIIENSYSAQNVTNQQAPSEPLPPLPPQATSF